MKGFFISYTQVDEPWAKWIAWTLEEAGFSVDIQVWDFRPGENFVLRMHQATAEADKTIVVLSPDYLKSEFTRPEWTAAFAQDPQGNARKLIPIRVAKCEPTGLLASIIYVDLLGLAQDDARAVLLGAFSERTKPTSMPAFPGAQGPSVTTKPAYPGHITATSTSTAKVMVRLLESADHSRVSPPLSASSSSNDLTAYHRSSSICFYLP
jgi:TIR domain